MMYVPLDFENGLTVNYLVDSKFHVTAIAQNELDTIKEQAAANIFKLEDPLANQNQKASGQLEEPLATATLKFDIQNPYLC